MGSHHFPETSFHLLVVFLKGHSLECHLTELSHSQIVKELELHNANRHFPNNCLAGRHLAENHFSDKALSRIPFDLNVSLITFIYHFKSTCFVS